MDNNVSSTSPVPTFVPRIVMVATYTQDTQTHSITVSVSTQTDGNVLNTHATQTNQITSRNEQTQTFPALGGGPSNYQDTTQVERGKTTALQINKNKRRKSGLVKINKTSQKLQQTPSQDLRVPVIDLTQQEIIPFDFLQEHTQSLETFSTSEPLLINIQDIDISTVQPMNIEQPQPIQHPTTFQQMSSQQRAALTNAALINFFGNAGTVENYYADSATDTTTDRAIYSWYKFNTY